MIISRGEVWFADLGSTVGREQAGARPVLIVSEDEWNRSLGGLVVTIPLTTRDRGIVARVPVQPPEGGLKHKSFVICEQVRCISRKRLIRRLGAVSPETLGKTEDWVRAILDL
ncbi:MAG: type II toxin-antitoxin system PemK/MazF family toxin [Actinomycetota bacterium]